MMRPICGDRHQPVGAISSERSGCSRDLLCRSRRGVSVLRWCRTCGRRQEIRLQTFGCAKEPAGGLARDASETR